MTEPTEKVHEKIREFKSSTRSEMIVLIGLWEDGLCDEWNLLTQIVSRLMMFVYEKERICVER